MNYRFGTKGTGMTKPTVQIVPMVNYTDGEEVDAGYVIRINGVAFTPVEALRHAVEYSSTVRMAVLAEDNRRAREGMKV